MPITETGEHGLERLKVATRLGAFIRFYCVPVYGSSIEYPFSVDFSTLDLVGATKTNLKYLMDISGGPAEIVPDEGQSSIGGFQLVCADIDGEFFKYLCEPALTLQSSMTSVSPGAAGVITVSSVAGLPAKGTIRITTASVVEKIRYSSKNTLLSQLTVSARGVDGTSAAAHAINDPLTNNEVIRPGARAEIFTGYQALNEVKYISRAKMEVTGRRMGEGYTSFVVDVSDVQWSFVRQLFISATQATPVNLTGNPLTLFLRILLSTGNGTNGPYDVLGALNGLGVPQALVNVTEIELLRDADFPTDSYSFTLVEPEDGKTFLEREILKTSNCYGVIRAGKYTVKRFNEALLI